MGMRVEFNSVEEFIAELRHGGAVEPVLRVTNSFTPSSLSPNIHHLRVLATHLVERGGLLQVLALERFIGDLWGSPEDSKVILKADAIEEQLAAAAKELKLEVRAGVYAPTQPRVRKGDPPII